MVKTCKEKIDDVLLSFGLEKVDYFYSLSPFFPVFVVIVLDFVSLVVLKKL